MRCVEDIIVRVSDAVVFSNSFFNTNTVLTNHFACFVTTDSE